MKSVCDGLFGRLSNERTDACLRKAFFEPEEMVLMHGDNHKVRKEIDATIPDEEYIMFWPPAREAVETKIMSLASLPAPIRSCYSWSFTRCDFRRATLFGRGVDANVLKCIHARAHKLEGHKTSEWVSPIVEDPPLRDADDGEAEEADDGEAATVSHQTRFWKGWKLSYRMQEPDRVSPMQFVACLDKKRLFLDDIIPELPPPTRRRTLETVQEDAAARRRRQTSPSEAGYNFHIKVW